MKDDLERWWYVSSLREKLEVALSILIAASVLKQLVFPPRPPGRGGDA